MGIHASPTVRDGLRREGRRHRLPRRRGEPRPRVHVHHDECRAPLGRASRAWRSPSAPTSARSRGRASACRAGPSACRAPRPRPIIQHPDVKRMLLTMKAHDRGDARARLLDLGAARPRAQALRTRRERKRCQALVDLLIPVVKGWSTENGIEVASLGIQVHGGMGFIEETGAAQHLRDARITTIYEGTTGIQANDLVGRKVGREAGRTALRPASTRWKSWRTSCWRRRTCTCRTSRDRFSSAVARLKETTQWIVRDLSARTRPRSPRARCTYLKLMGITLGGWMMARSAQIACRQLEAGEGDGAFLRAQAAHHALLRRPHPRATPWAWLLPPCAGPTARSRSRTRCSDDAVAFARPRCRATFRRQLQAAGAALSIAEHNSAALRRVT